MLGRIRKLPSRTAPHSSGILTLRFTMSGNFIASTLGVDSAPSLCGHAPPHFCIWTGCAAHLDRLRVSRPEHVWLRICLARFHRHSLRLPPYLHQILPIIDTTTVVEHVHITSDSISLKYVKVNQPVFSRSQFRRSRNLVRKSHNVAASHVHFYVYSFYHAVPSITAHHHDSFSNTRKTTEVHQARLKS